MYQATAYLSIEEKQAAEALKRAQHQAMKLDQLESRIDKLAQLERGNIPAWLAAEGHEALESAKASLRAYIARHI